MNLTVLKKVSRELPAKVRGPQRTETVGTPLRGEFQKVSWRTRHVDQKSPWGLQGTRLCTTGKSPNLGDLSRQEI